MLAASAKASIRHAPRISHISYTLTLLFAAEIDRNRLPNTKFSLDGTRQKVRIRKVIKQYNLILARKELS